MMPTLSAINIVRHKKEVMRICASHGHLREQNASSDTQRAHRQRIKPKLKANQQTIVSYRNTDGNNNKNGNRTGGIDHYYRTV